MNQRQRQRRTLGSGPPPDLLFGELAYSDTDGLLHCGRPDGSVRSFGDAGEAGPHDHTWDSITSKPATFPPSAHDHTWDSITSKPQTYPPSTHAHSWSQITNTPVTYPPSTHTHSYAAISHGHAATEIALTPINGFASVVAGSNKLIVWPGLGLACVVFSVSRASIPAGGTQIFLWDAAYTPTHPARANVAGVQFSPSFALDFCHMVLSGSALLFYQLQSASTNYALIDGEILFRYA